MTRIPSFVNVTSEDVQNVDRGTNEFDGVEIDQFLQLMVTQLQNQDPLDPTDNSEIVTQISQMREIASTNLLIETLQGVLTGQNLGTASNLIGKRITALTDAGDNVEGVVDSVSVDVSQNGSNEEVRTYKLHVGDDRIDLKNVRQVLPAGGEADGDS